MSRTKPNPIVDTERKIYMINSGTLLGSGDMGGASPCPSDAHMCNGGNSHVNKTPKMCYMYIMKYYSAIKKNGTLPFVTTLVDPVFC